MAAHEERSPPGMTATAPQMCAILSLKKRTQGKVGQQQKESHIGQELTGNENEKQATEIALTASESGKTSQNMPKPTECQKLR
jgi:hypothetical protein